MLGGGAFLVVTSLSSVICLGRYVPSVIDLESCAVLMLIVHILAFVLGIVFGPIVTSKMKSLRSRKAQY